MSENSLLRTDKEFIGLYDRNVDRIYRLAYLYLKNADDAEDAVQNVFLKMLQSEVTFRDQEHEKAWLITVTRNHCKDVLRSWWRRKCVDLNCLSDVASQTDDVSARDMVMELLQLPEKYKIVLYLYHIEGYSIREISAILKRNKDHSIGSGKTDRCILQKSVFSFI